MKRKLLTVVLPHILLILVSSSHLNAFIADETKENDFTTMTLLSTMLIFLSHQSNRRQTSPSQIFTAARFLRVFSFFSDLNLSNTILPRELLAPPRRGFKPAATEPSCRLQTSTKTHSQSDATHLNKKIVLRYDDADGDDDALPSLMLQFALLLQDDNNGDDTKLQVFDLMKLDDGILVVDLFLKCCEFRLWFFCAG